MVIGSPLHLLWVGIPPCVPASVGTEIFRLSALYLENGLSALAAFDPNRIFQRMTANIRTDGIEGYPQGKGNTSGGFAPGAHGIQTFDFLFGHSDVSLL